MTGAGKSVIVADLLAQIGHRFGFRLIVEEGLSHAVLSQTQGCEPIVVNPNEFFSLQNSPRIRLPCKTIQTLNADCEVFWYILSLFGRARSL